MKFLLGVSSLVLHLSSFSTNTWAGGADVGGGGGYRINGKIVTLPEFGILIEGKELTGSGKRFETYYKLSAETREEVKRIASMLKTKFEHIDLNVEKIIGDVNTYISRKNVDLTEYQKIKEEYKKVLEINKFDFQEDKFVLPAVSIKGKTYIFPDFDELTPLQQAKYVYHEFIMRQLTELEPVAKLEMTLRFDSLVEKLLKNLPVNEMQALKVMADVKIINKSDLFTNVLVDFIDSVERPVFLDEISQLDLRSKNMSLFNLDPSLIQELQDASQLNVNFAEMLEGVSLLSLEHEIYGGHPGYSKFCKKLNVAEKERRFLVKSSNALKVAKCSPNGSVYLYPSSLVSNHSPYFDR